MTYTVKIETVFEGADNEFRHYIDSFITDEKPIHDIDKEYKTKEIKFICRGKKRYTHMNWDNCIKENGSNGYKYFKVQVINEFGEIEEECEFKAKSFELDSVK